MLNIYYGAETTDKEKFVFDNIKGRTLLLVPDQFSLQAERDAFFYLNKKSLMDLRIMALDSIGHKAVREVGGRPPKLIDEYGSQMLLTKVLGQVEKDLTIFRGFSWKSSFIDRVYNVISSMKKYGIGADELDGAIGKLSDESYLKYKMSDICKIYEAYQKQLDGKYLDADDYILFYGEKILNAPMVTEAEVWIYGFDTFTQKNMLIIERLIKAARNVNIVLTYEEGNELFDITKYFMDKLTKAAEDINEEVSVNKIEGHPKKTFWDDANITLAAASNIYAEAERAAAYILELVRDHDYKFGDIVVVCNDMEARGNVLRRTFERWGIPVFVDRKRQVMHHPAVSCLMAIMEIAAGGYKTESVMRMIKSGLFGFSHDECDLLENYVMTFKIRGNGWKAEFEKTGDKYTAEDLELLNSLRTAIVNTIEKAKESIGKYNTAGEKTKGLYTFLDRDFEMPERIENIIARQEAAGFAEGAAETAQSWSVICNILDQIVETIGEEKISNEELLKLITIGMETVEIGIVPVSTDRVMIGPLQRTRLSRVKVLLMVGVNVGVMPSEIVADGLINDREMAALEEVDLEMFKRDSVVRMEEMLAIYRMMQLPEERLYMSYSETGEKGELQRPSEIFEGVRGFMAASGDVDILGDLDKTGDVFDMLTSRQGTLSYMTDAVRKHMEGYDIDDDWIDIINWYDENMPEEMDKIRAGMFFDNTVEVMGRDISDALYRGDNEHLAVSASRLERYSGCPFSHFIMYGLRAQTPEVYEMGSREQGDIYHRCLMMLSNRLTPPAASGLDVNDPMSPWMTITEEECRREVSDIIDRDAGNFKEGIMAVGKAEEYRTERIKSICCDAAWTMIKQVRKGDIKNMYFEQPFGAGRSLAPVKVDVGGQEVLIQGKIDRLDVFHDDAVRVIDYKSGSADIDMDHIAGGYKLQLMVYLKAAVDGFRKEPAGVFYFKIKELMEDTSSVPSGSVAGRLDKAYRLVGIMVDDKKYTDAMDIELAAEQTGSSTVIPIKKKDEDGNLTPYSDSELLADVDFGELMSQVEGQVQRICTEICDGKVDIRPKKEKKKVGREYKTACKYCGYSSICMFDTQFDCCNFELI